MKTKAISTKILTFGIGENEEIRVILSVEDSGIGFCLNDIAEVLDISRRDMRRMIPSHDKIQYRAPTEGGDQWMNFVTAEGLGDLLLTLPYARVKKLLRILNCIILPGMRCFLNLLKFGILDPNDKDAERDETESSEDKVDSSEKRHSQESVKSKEIVVKIQTLQ